MRRFGFKPTKAQLARTHAATADFYAAAHDKPRVEIPTVKKRAKPRQLEAPVVAAVAELLAVHPKVLFAVRQNSGAASYEAASGKWAPVYFYRIVTGQEVRIVDFWGLLKDGRMLALECKRPGWTKPTDQREREQWAFLYMVQNVGGVSGFVRSVDEAKTILDNA